MHMDILTKKKCEPCEGGILAMTRTEFTPYLEQVSEWIVIDEKALERDFSFKNFKEALAFINDVGAIAEEEGHHPDMFLHGWNKVKFTVSTHAVGGLSVNDFILAAKIDEL